jgi:type I restriction enzyme R subunit
VEAIYTSDEARRRFQILARVVFSRFKALLVEPSALIYAERHDNLKRSTRNWASAGTPPT